MTFQQLQYLLETHRTGSVSQAAKNLFVAQSSVSTALNSLEKELGHPLFLRTKSGLKPTTQGIHYIEHASRIWESYQAMTAPQQKGKTNVRIHALKVAPVHKAFLTLVEENKGRRDIFFSLSTGNSINALKFFNVELALPLILSPNYFLREAEYIKSGLTCKVIATLPAALRIGKGHPLYHAPTINLSSLQNDMLLDTASEALSQGLIKGGIMQINSDNIIVSTHPEVNRELIIKGLAYSVRSILPGASEYEDDQRLYPLDGLTYKLCLVTNPLQPRSAEVERFLQLLQQELTAAGIANI